MDFSKYTGIELIHIYGELLSQMRKENLIRSKNVTGDIGEYIVIDHYTKTKGLPKLQICTTVHKEHRCYQCQWRKVFYQVYHYKYDRCFLRDR